jgi:hypothetical protein
MAAATCPLIFATARIENGWFIDVFIPVDFSTTRTASKTAGCTAMEIRQGSPDVRDSIDMAIGIRATCVSRAPMLRGDGTLDAARPLIIDLDTAATDLQSEHC